jgi:hypothetical protein
MESEPKEKGRSSSGPITTIEAVRLVAAHNARAPLDSEEQMLLFLQSWWSRTYNRPLKDPLLLEYTIEELTYEFYDRIERQKAFDESLEQEGDKMEEAKDKEAEDWAEKMEREEREADLAKEATKSDAKVPDQTKTAANVAWMEEQLRANKEVHGEDFGEDIDEQFE